MKGGRRNLKQGALEGCPEPQPGETLMRVLSLRGSNLIEVEDSNGEKTLCMLPAKFRKIMWIKIGNFVLVEEGDREKATEAGNKVTGTIVKVLYDEHIRSLQKTSFWPPTFQNLNERATPVFKQSLSAHGEHDRYHIEHDDDDDDDDEDGLPPLEANLNRQQPGGHVHASDTDAESEDD